MHSINLNTKIFCSFSKQAGSTGTSYFNKRFKEDGYNAIYKGFSVGSISDALKSMKVLGISGAGISAPYKIETLMFVEEVDPTCLNIGAANTVINRNGILKAYNTDYIAVTAVLQNTCLRENKPLIILGKGGYARSVKWSARLLKIPYEEIHRDNWGSISSIRERVIFNATPVRGIKTHESNTFIDSDPNSLYGSILAELQADAQYELYKELITV